MKKSYPASQLHLSGISLNSLWIFLCLMLRPERPVRCLSIQKYQVMFWLCNRLKAYTHRTADLISLARSFLWLQFELKTSTSILNWGCKDRKYHFSNDFSSSQPRDKATSLRLLDDLFSIHLSIVISPQTLQRDVMVRWLILMFFRHSLARQRFSPWMQGLGFSPSSFNQNFPLEVPSFLPWLWRKPRPTKLSA